MIDSGERSTCRASAARRSTSTRPAGWATRSRCRWRRWSPRAARRSPALGPRARSHRRHARQARGHPRLAGDAAHREVVAQLREVGAVICAASDTLCPADRKLYALRDVTATVESIPLIASSIMSKKIAEGTEALVLDVKVGSGAFLPEIDTARRLAETMVGLGQAQGRAHGGAHHRHGRAARAGPAATASRSSRPARCCAAAVRPTSSRSRWRWPSEMLPLAGIAPATTGSPRRAGRRAGPRRVGRHDPGPGRRSRRRPAGGHRSTARCGRPTRATCAASTPAPSGWRCGGSAPAAPARRIPCRRRPGRSACASRATRSRPASRCCCCTPTTRPACRARWPR